MRTPRYIRRRKFEAMRPMQWRPSYFKRVLDIPESTQTFRWLKYGSAYNSGGAE